MSDRYIDPLVLSDDGKRHEPLAPGRLVNPQWLPVSAEEGNALRNVEDGYVVTANDLVSTQAPNAIAVNVDNKLRVMAGTLLDMDEMVISVTDNALKTNLKLNFIKSESKLEILGINDYPVASVKLPEYPGLPIVAEILQDYQPPMPEGAEENPNPVGTYLHLAFRMADESLKHLYLNVGDLVDIYRGDGETINVSGGVISVIPGYAMTNTVTGVAVDVHKLPYMHPYAALTADGNKLRVWAKNLVKPKSKVLSGDDFHIDATLALSFIEDENTVVLSGIDNAEVARVKLPEFIGKPLNIEVLRDFTPPAPEGSVEAPFSAGTWMHVTWRLSDGSVEGKYYNIDEVTDIFTAGPGVEIADGVVSVLPSAGGGIRVDTTGVAVNPSELVSTHSPNAIVVHDDDKLWFDPKRTVHPFDKIVFVADNYIKSELSVEYDSETNNIMLRGRNGAVVSQAKLPEPAGMPVIVEVLKDFAPPAGGGAEESPLPTGTYLHLAFRLVDGTLKHLYLNLSELTDIYTGGNGIKVEDNVISIDVTTVVSDEDGNMLEVKGDKLYARAPVAGFGIKPIVNGKISVDVEQLVEPVVENGISAADGALFTQDVYNPKYLGNGLTASLVPGIGKRLELDVPAIAGAVVAPSEENEIRLEDGKLFSQKLHDTDSIRVSETRDELNVALAPGMGLGITKQGLEVVPANIVSLQEGNTVTVGSDGKLFVATPKQLEAGHAIRPIGADGKINVNASPLVEPVVENGLVSDGATLFVQDVYNEKYLGDGLKALQVPGIGKRLFVRIAVKDDNQLKVDADGGLYVEAGITGDKLAPGLKLDDQGKLALDIDLYSPLRINGNGQLSLDMSKIAGGVSSDADNILKNGSDGKPFYPANLGTL